VVGAQPPGKKTMKVELILVTRKARSTAILLNEEIVDENNSQTRKSCHMVAHGSSDFLSLCFEHLYGQSRSKVENVMLRRPTHAILGILTALALVLIAGCGGDDDPIGPENPTAPVVTTFTVSDISQVTAVCGGDVISSGGAAVTARGVCWATDPMPTIEDNKTIDDSGTGSFASSIAGLASNTLYYLRAYATNSAGTGYGEERLFTTRDSTGTVTDIDGNVYQTIKIGNQWWMAENLRVTRYRNGNPIQHVTNAGTWDNLSSGAYCNYGHDEGNVSTYGRLYNWYAVHDSRSIAPAGWHVPSDEEWKQLEVYLGMSQSDADATGWRGADEGGKLKEVGTTHWASPNNGATNESGFSALPGGYLGYIGVFVGMGNYAFFWSSTEGDWLLAWHRLLYYTNSQVNRGDDLTRHYGLSVRCIRDY